MNVKSLFFAYARTVAVLLPLALASQAAEVGYLFPAGGAPGTSFDVSVWGHALNTANAVTVSGDGVEAAVTGFIPRPPASTLRAAAPDGEVRLRITVAPNATPGPRDLRLVCSNGYTAPLTFEIGRYSEITEQEPNVGAKRETALTTLPVSINGRLGPGDSDTFRFRAIQGQTLVARLKARAFASRLSDAGDAPHPHIAFLDAQGRELTSANGFRFDTDPIAVLKVPATGSYALTVREARPHETDSGVYRLTLGELPLVTGFSPMGVRKGDHVNVTLEGVNLPPQKIRIFSGNKTDETCLQTLIGDKLAVPGLRFDLDTLPEETADDADNAAQPVPFPSIINGTLARPGATGRFTFEGRAGQTVAIETRARMLGSPLDARLEIADGQGNVLASQGRTPGVFTDLYPDFCDASLLVRLPADGRYEVRLRDARGQGGPGCHYRLRISEPRPDFELWVSPPTLSLPLGGSVKACAYVRRIDGFSGPISINLDNPPLGISSAGGHIASNACENLFTVSVVSSNKRLPHMPFDLTLCGVATNGTDVLKRLAIPAHRMPSASDYRHLTPDATWMANIGDPVSSAAALCRIALPESATCVHGTSHAPFTVAIASGRSKPVSKHLNVEVAEPAQGFRIIDVADDPEHPGQLLATLRSDDGADAPPKMGKLAFLITRKTPPSKRAKRALPAAVTTQAVPYALD